MLNFQIMTMSQGTRAFEDVTDFKSDAINV